MNQLITPDGMNRRHFLRHLAASSALAGPALALSGSIRAHAKELSRGNKSCILLWMGGGPPTIDMWDLKPGAATGGPFSAINTKGDIQICEHLPLLANQMQHLSVIRSMSTSEADHERGTYYMHTGYKPNPNVEHPSYGSVVAHQLEEQIPELEIPPFVSIGGSSEGPGFLGMAYAPFEVSSSGQVRNLQSRGVEWQRLQDRMLMLESLEKRFIREERGNAAGEHAKVLSKTYDLLTSQQLDAFKVRSEPEPMRELYGDTGFGRGCLMARRLVEAGVPFIEVNFGGWDLHDDCFNRLETKLPELDKSMSALVSDLVDRGLWENTVVLCMGEFGRTPRINGDAGRDHFARAWSVVAGGGGIQGGRAIGQTSADGTRVETDPYSSEDLMATICQGMGISLKTTFTASNGRPMKIAGGGRPIADLFT